MSFFCRQTVFVFIMLQLLSAQASDNITGDFRDCEGLVIGTYGTSVASLSKDVQAPISRIQEEEIRSKVEAFFRAALKEENTESSKEYLPPKIKIKSLTDGQNELLNTIIARNATAIKENNSIITDEIPSAIYTIPSLNFKKYNISPAQFNKNYTAQIKKMEESRMSIFSVASGSAIGAVIGVCASNAHPNDDSDT